MAQNSRQQRIDSLLTAVHANGLFNGVALVADSGNIILHKGYGVADRANNTPLSVDDRFYIGSLTKQFTAVLILQLQEAGLLNINNSVAIYLEEFNKPAWAGITIHQLLTHTSGLGSYTSHPDFDKAVPYSEQAMFQFIKHPLLFHPGTDWSYSNSGYFLLGIIAERVSNTEYGTLLHENIFVPLKMSSTKFDTKWLEKNAAKGYRRTVAGITPMPAYTPSTLFSTGGMYSTARDLYAWTQGLNGNALLSDNSLEILFQPLQHDYACGVYVKRGTDENGNSFERHFHGGLLQGYHSYLLRRLPQKQVVILLDNFHNSQIQTIKNRIWSALEDEEIREVKPKLSYLLFDACKGDSFIPTIDSIANNTSAFEAQFLLEEFDINTVGYRLMEADRHAEAYALFEFNRKRYPESWNVYDSMGELQLKQGNFQEAERLYRKSLELNPDNTSAENALEKMRLTRAKYKLH